MVNIKRWMEESFPSLKNNDYTVTSESDTEYNCVAWAAGDSSAWWSHLQGYRWPDGKRTDGVEGLIEVFKKLGYEICESIAIEDAYEKIAVFAKSEIWTHAARQLPNGRWTSKLGVNEDIEHLNLDGLTGELYGTIHCIMRRPRP